MSMRGKQRRGPAWWRRRRAVPVERSEALLAFTALRVACRRCGEVRALVPELGEGEAPPAHCPLCRGPAEVTAFAMGKTRQVLPRVEVWALPDEPLKCALVHDLEAVPAELVGRYRTHL
jgi:hypothetical protein